MEAPACPDLVDAVLDAIDEAKGNDPMAPVEVLCAIGARRLRLELGRRRGLANVTVRERPSTRAGLEAATVLVGPLRDEARTAVDEREGTAPLVRISIADTLDVTGARIVSCTDASVEARVIADALRRARIAGVPWSSMAVAVAGPGIAPIVDACRRAAIPVVVGPPRHVSRSAAGRFAIGMCDVLASGGSRASVSALWCAMPLHQPGDPTPIPIVDWERLSRRCLVVGGRDWERAGDAGLVAFVRSLCAPAPSPAAAILAAMTTFVPGVESAAWQDAFGGASGAEGEASDVVRSVLFGLARADPIPTAAELRVLLVDSLGRAPMPIGGRIGEGVQIDRPEHLATGDYSFVAVTGMTEASQPRSPDASAIRIAALAQLLRPDRSERIITVPRVDQRAEREGHPSPVLLAAVANVVGRVVDGATVHDAPSAHGLPIERVDSLAAALLGTHGLFALDDTDVATRTLHARPVDTDLLTHPLVRAHSVTRTIVADRARRSPAWTSFDGALTRPGNPAEHTWPVTTIEAFLTCPLRVFLRHGLGAAPLDRPEDSADPNARATGTVAHAVLDRLVQRWLSLRRTEGTTPQWTAWLRALDAASVNEVWHATIAEQRARGTVHDSALWDAQLRWLHARLTAFIAAEATDDSGFAPVASELGARRDDPWLVSTPDGVMRVTGRVDRIDTDGETLRVIDFKTGSLPTRAEVTADPLDDGRRVQLHLYAAMHRSRHGHDEHRVEGRYVNPLRASSKDRFLAFDLTGGEERATAVVASLAAAYGGGDLRYRAGPSAENCRFCDVRACCPADRERSERMKRTTGPGRTS